MEGSLIGQARFDEPLAQPIQNGVSCLMRDDVVGERRVMPDAVRIVEVAEEDGVSVGIVEGVGRAKGRRHQE